MPGLEQRCQRIELLLSDVDGVLTNGGVVFDNQGIESKRFHIRDGLGIKLWQRAGGKFGIITGRASHIVKLRAAELGIELIRQGIEDKWLTVRQLMSELQLQPEQVAFIGDDLPDRPVMMNVGLGIAVADAAEDVRQAAHHVTTLSGGYGAVREAVEMILRKQGRWQDLLQRYGGTGESPSSQ
ncbi:MAG: HAD hydrolase family protein [Planctomycetota bacterium]|nr:HAD hydrolase family protein [Planctomycetota bacterium]